MENLFTARKSIKCKCTNVYCKWRFVEDNFVVVHKICAIIHFAVLHCIWLYRLFISTILSQPRTYVWYQTSSCDASKLLYTVASERFVQKNFDVMKFHDCCKLQNFINLTVTKCQHYSHVLCLKYQLWRNTTHLSLARLLVSHGLHTACLSIRDTCAVVRVHISNQ